MIVRHYTLSFGVFTVQRNFMGIELDVLVGHPEHELVFFGVDLPLQNRTPTPRQIDAAAKRLNSLGER